MASETPDFRDLQSSMMKVGNQNNFKIKPSLNVDDDHEVQTWIKTKVGYSLVLK